MAIAELDDTRAAELGPLLRDTACVVKTLCRPEQIYVCMWSHGRDARRHLHIAIQPVTAEVRARYGGLRSEQLQARMLADGDELDITEVEQFCERARELFRAMRPCVQLRSRQCHVGNQHRICHRPQPENALTAINPSQSSLFWRHQRRLGRLSHPRL
jgi:hypothetical protein